MKLITEIFEDDCEVITESTEDGKKNYFIEGIFMQGDLKNRNGRIYPSDILEKEMKRYKNDFIDTKRALGELGHPEGPQINGDRVSHLITEMKRDGSDFIGKAKILGTPMGNIVKTFIDEGVKVGVSTRGLGSVKPSKEGIMEVQNDFHLATVDVVTDPSGPNCFVNGIMENTEYYFDIATASWRENGNIAQLTNEDTAPETVAEIPVNLVSEEAFEEAMKRLQVLEDTIREIKNSFSKPSVKLDEQKTLQIFSTYLNSIKK